jgi:hypothetical protein
MSDPEMIVAFTLGGFAVAAFCIFVSQGYRQAVGEPSTCLKCRNRRPGQFCSRCGHKKF